MKQKVKTTVEYATPHSALLILVLALTDSVCIFEKKVSGDWVAADVKSKYGQTFYAWDDGPYFVYTNTSDSIRVRVLVGKGGTVDDYLFPVPEQFQDVNSAYFNPPLGIKGPMGDQGLQGEQGDQGDPGPQGIQGDKGDQGDQGDQGIQGIQGIQGGPGSAGVKGDKGDQGIQGLQGLQGIPGIQGVSGIQGPAGTGARLGTPSQLTIAAGTITVTGSFHTLFTASAADLTQINGGSAGDLLLLTEAAGGATVTVKSTGNVRLGANRVLSNTSRTLLLIYTGSLWLETAWSPS